MLTPVTSEGSRSGVNWRRSKEQPRERASDLASIVLPTPGTSSIRMWPRLSSAMAQSSISALLPTSTRLTFSAIRAPGASTDPFSICILVYFLFSDPVPVRVDVMCLSNAMGRRTFTRPAASAPRDVGHHAADRATTQHQHIIDDQPQRVQAGRTHRTDRAHCPGQFLDNDERDGHDHAGPYRTSRWSDEARERSRREQRPERQQSLGDRLPAMTTKDQGRTGQLDDHRDHQAQPRGEPVHLPLSLRPRHGTWLSVPDMSPSNSRQSSHVSPTRHWRMRRPRRSHSASASSRVAIPSKSAVPAMGADAGWLNPPPT